jgi:hypothetical protein
MCDLARGDVVKFVGYANCQVLQTQYICPVSGFDYSRLYIVADVFDPCCSSSGILWGVTVSDGPQPTRSYAWDARGFRRVYRPKADLISKLLEPVDLGVDAVSERGRA